MKKTGPGKYLYLKQGKEYTSTLVKLPFSMYSKFKAVCRKRRIPMTRVVYACMTAVIAGDITIKETSGVFFLRNGLTATLNDLSKIELYDREGKLLNPTIIPD